MDINEFIDNLPNDINLLVKCKQQMNELLSGKLRTLRKIKQTKMKKKLVVRPRIYISDSSSDASSD